jgi:hypothetical protein
VRSICPQGRQYCVVVLATADWVEVSALATGALAVATFGFVVVAWLQRSDTRAAAEAATRAALASEASLTLQQATYSEQSRLATYPVLACDCTFDSSFAYLRLHNVSAVPALDIDLMVVDFRLDEYDDYEDYVVKFVKQEYVDRFLGHAPDEDGTWGVYDHLCYGDVPPGRSIRAPLDFLGAPESLLVLLQFRDLLGRNYIRSYWIYKSSNALKADAYVVNTTTEPDPALGESPRLSLLKTHPVVGTDTARTITTAPAAVDEEFLPAFNHSIPSGMLNKPQMSVEDRGVWSS